MPPPHAASCIPSDVADYGRLAVDSPEEQIALFSEQLSAQEKKRCIRRTASRLGWWETGESGRWERSGGGGASKETNAQSAEDDDHTLRVQLGRLTAAIRLLHLRSAGDPRRLMTLMWRCERTASRAQFDEAQTTAVAVRPKPCHVSSAPPRHGISDVQDEDTVGGSAAVVDDDDSSDGVIVADQQQRDVTRPSARGSAVGCQMRQQKISKGTVSSGRFTPRNGPWSNRWMESISEDMIDWRADIMSDRPPAWSSGPVGNEVT
jgi:hypothetical protein